MVAVTMPRPHPENEVSESAVKALITRFAQHPDAMDTTTLDYIVSYFRETPADEAPGEFTLDHIRDFVGPLVQDALDENAKSVEKLVHELRQLCVDSLGLPADDEESAAAAAAAATASRLDAPMVMSEVAMGAPDGKAKKGEFAHVQSQRGPRTSTVDEAKLREQERQREKKLEKRREKEGAAGDAGRTWTRNPMLIVNQVNSRAATAERSRDVALDNFDISYGGRPILQGASLQLVAGRRYGLVGRNGIGKSTLLRALSTGELRIPTHIRLLHVEQEIAGDDTPAIEAVLAADTERASLLAEEKRLEERMGKFPPASDEYKKCAARLQEVYDRLQATDADAAEPRAYAILSGLGFVREQMQAATRTFSGGWRMRLALARALFCRPDLLLADEVTNYLDFPAVVWLERYFQRWQGTLLVVSHDRSFLDSVVTDILHMHDATLDAYRGDFTSFVATRAERRKALVREYEAQLQYRQHLQSFIDKWRYNANRAAQAQSKIKILEKLGPLTPPPAGEMDGLGCDDDASGKGVFFRFPAAERISPPIIQLDGVSFSYPRTAGAEPRVILDRVTLDVTLDSKTAIVGPNGAGKSTLVHLITGELAPTAGIVHRHGRLRLALFSQHHVDMLDLNSSSVEFLQTKFPGRPAEEYRRFLGRYGLSGMSALQPIGTLSGGQKSRVVFAWMAMQSPHVLILDEPTNHLDMDSIEALAAGLRAFDGGILIVSHDERFLDSVCTEVCVLNGGSLTRFEGQLGSPDGVVRQYKASLRIED